MHSGQLYPLVTWLEASEAGVLVCGDRKHPDKLRVRILASAHMTDHSPPLGTELPIFDIALPSWFSAWSRLASLGS